MSESTLTPESETARVAVRDRFGWGLVLVILIGTLLLRLSSLLGNHLQVDEPRWMARGLFLVEALLEGDFETLQTKHWTGSVTPQMSRLSAGLATGTVTALGAGAGLQLESRLYGSDSNAPFRKIFMARAWSVLLSGVTPLLLFLFLRKVWSEVGAAAAAGFLMLEPIVQYWGGMAHLEACLTLAIPLSLLLYDRARRERSAALLLAAGAVFGIAFATRANAAVVFLVLIVLSVLRLVAESRQEGRQGQRILADVRRLFVFGGVGWLVFVLLYPPIWRLPLRGFLAFIKVYLDSSAPTSSGGPGLMGWLGAHSELALVFLILSLLGLLSRSIRREPIFQMGITCYALSFLVLSLPAAFHARYLSSVMPALALSGAATVSVFWKSYGGRLGNRALRGLRWGLGGGILLLCSASLAGAWKSHQSTQEVYGTLQSLQFSEVHFPVRRVKFVRAGADPAGRRLFVTSGDSTPGLVAVYLDVLLTDQGKLSRIGNGWSRVRQEEGARCREGDWEYGSRRAERRADQRSVGYRRLFIGPCRE